MPAVLFVRVNYVKEITAIFTVLSMSKQFHKLLIKNGLKPIRLHDLRHSCASNLLASGVPMKEIQEWLGHSNYSTTADVYSHLDFSVKVKAASTLATAYEENPKPVAAEQRKSEPQDEMAVFAKAIKEMAELGIEKIEDYIAYKEQQALQPPHKTPPQM